MIYYIKPWIYPILLNVNLLIACLVPYFEATKEGHIGKQFPFISDAGVSGIAAALFSLFFSLYAFLSFVVMTLRFEQVKAKYCYREERCLYIANVVIYGIGLMACVGVCLFANFREQSEPEALLHTHMAGTFIAFALGMMYFVLQSIYSFFWKELPGRRLCTNIFRVVLSAAHFALFIAFIVLLEKYMNTFDNTVRKRAAILEWIFAFFMTFYVLTFIPEFYKLDLKVVVANSSEEETDDSFPRLVLQGSNARFREADEQNSRLVEIEETDALLDEYDGGCSSDDNMLL